jgi:cytochrome c oxidase cbb3-type subunit 1
VSEIDTSARLPLSVLFGFALLWLVVSGGLALLNLAQTLAPWVAADCAWLTYGRTHALQESAAVYGWGANVGFGVALWLLGRLGGSPLRSLNWVTVGALFWNAGVALGLIGISLGDGTWVPWLHLPRSVLPLLLVAFSAIAFPGVLAWTGRAHKAMFAAQWYAVAALFLFPWLFSAAQVMLLWLPLRGVVQAVAAAWYAQGAWSLWLAPLALAAAYYLVPKISGRALPAYDFAGVAFWTLLVVGGWTAGRHLVGGPVPAWIASLGIVASTLLLFHYLVVLLNLRGAFRGGSVPLRFVAFGVGAYVLGGVADAATALRTIAQTTQFTWVTQAQTQLALTGAFSMVMLGAVYFLVPRIANQPWPSLALIRAHYAASVIGVGALVLGLAVAGVEQGLALADPKLNFADIALRARSWLLIAVAGQAVLLIGNAVLAVHFGRLLFTKPAQPAAAALREPAVMEVPAS